MRVGATTSVSFVKPPEYLNRLSEHGQPLDAHSNASVFWQACSRRDHTVGIVPPSMTYSDPVIVAARSEARKATRFAISPGSDGRPIGTPPSESMISCEACCESD